MNLLYPGSGAVAHDFLSIAVPNGGPLVQLENEHVRCSVLPWFGADIVELTDKRTGIDVLRPGEGAIHNVVSQSAAVAAGQEYFNRRIGGWPELFPTGGAVADYLGARAPFHGESNQRRWQYAIVEPGPQRAAVRFTLHCGSAPLVLTREMRLDAGAGELVLAETIENLADFEVPFMWGHHPTYGRPLLADGTRIELPQCRLIDGDESLLTCRGHDAGVSNMLYATDLAEGWFGLFNPAIKLGTGVRFDPKLFRFLWIWQEFGGKKDGPSFGRWYAAAVEPFTSLPQANEAFCKAGPMASIGPKARITTELTAFFYREPLSR